jgi:hypothetical protein
VSRNELGSSQILDEATSLFVGKPGVVGVGLSDSAINQLVVFLEHREPDQERAIKAWAKNKQVQVDFVIAGRFVAGSVA